MTQTPGAKVARSWAAFVALGLLGLLAFACFAALGTWQLQRRVWKLDLIQRVEHRVHAPPTPPPSPSQWAAITTAADEYKHVRVGGVFAHQRETLVQAVTDWGSGYWVLTPLRTDAGYVILINRGFVSADQRAPNARAVGQTAGHVTVTGLLRMTEPKGGFLRANAPLAGRWYSRDVKAIGLARGLSDAAPYFIDADATPNPGGWPLGGLTVIRFANSHLIYAIIWYSLALMTACGVYILLRDEQRAREKGSILGRSPLEPPAHSTSDAAAGKDGHADDR